MMIELVVFCLEYYVTFVSVKTCEYLIDCSTRNKTGVFSAESKYFSCDFVYLARRTIILRSSEILKYEKVLIKFTMAAKVTVALLALSCVILVTRYLRARDERESCLVTLDRNLGHMKEMKEEAASDRMNFQAQVRQQEAELETVKRDKITAESKQRLCDSQGEQKDKHIRLKEDTIDEKEKVILRREQDLQALSDKYIILEDEFKKKSTQYKDLKEEFDKLTLQLQKMKNNAETFSDKLLESEKKRVEVEHNAETLSEKLSESEKKRVEAEHEKSPAKRAESKKKENIKEPVQKSPKSHNAEEKLEAQIKDTDLNVEMQDNQDDFSNQEDFDNQEVEDKILKSQVKNVDTQFNFAPEIKESIMNQRVLAEPNSFGDKKLLTGDELESAASNEEGEALSEKMGHALSGVGAGDRERRNVNSGQEKSTTDPNNTENNFHGVNDSIVIG